jgi:large subunit ribosomal protein L25
MSQITVSAEKRDSAGKGVARKLRAQGLIPGVLYGRDSSPILFSTDEKTMANLMKAHGLNSILELELDGKKYNCMIAEYQKDVFQRNLLHIDFKLVDLDSKVIVKVPVDLIGEQVVRSRGGIAQLYLRELKIRVSAREIPKSIPLDISVLQPGESRKLDSIPLPSNLEKMDPPTITVVNVLAPRALAAARNLAAEEEAED